METCGCDYPTEKKIFLDCFDRNFKIGRRGSTGLAYPLNEEEYLLLIKSLEESNIPVLGYSEEAKSVMEGDYDEPANSKVVFSLPGMDKEFIIGNFNQCLILKRYSDGIEKALIAKGISARVEMMGSYAHKKVYQKADILFIGNKKVNKSLDAKNFTENKNPIEENKSSEDKKLTTIKKKGSKAIDKQKNDYKQLSLFDLP